MSPELLRRVTAYAIERKTIEQQAIAADRELKRLLSEAEIRNRQLAEMTRLDELTSLPNRKHFAEILNQNLQLAARREKCVGVLYFDLDGFKQVNDVFGHAAGDLVLVQVAARLRRDLRKSDFVARVGGDEFLVLTDLLDDPSQSYSVARKIAGCLAEPFRIKGHEVNVGVSVGIATYPEVEQPDELIACADHAMYQSKRQGTHFATFYSKRLQSEHEEKRELEQHLARAIQNRRLTAQFQPIMSRSGMIGMEVFPRWHHPNKGLLAPEQFVSVGDSENSLDKITESMLNIVARTASGLYAGRDVFFSINLFDQQLGSTKFVGKALDAVKQLNIDPSRICFEVTEANLHGNPISIEVLRELKSIGFKIALADYGNGPVSMKMLTQLPLDYLKLSAELTDNIDTNQTDFALCLNLIQFAHALQVAVIAKVVVSLAQTEKLRDLGCDYYQGDLISQPFSLPLT
jgi:diguanylate cyclase (GGDEF)-like protein